MNRTTEGVCGIVSQDWLNKVKRLIQELVDMEDKWERWLDRAKIESIRGFLLYVARIYWDMNPYLKGLHLTLDSCRPFKDEDV